MFQFKLILGNKIGASRSILASIVCLLLCSCKQVDLQQVADSIHQMQQPLDEKTVIAGLKQALEIGTANSVNQLKQKGGFSDNSLVHIALPEQLNKVALALDKIGLGSYGKKLELQLNRAAEAASGEAKVVFISSISRMSLSDAWGILKGSNSAATDYFRADTEQQLRSKFQPVINRSMQQVGLYADYKNLLQAYNSIPFTSKPDLNIENYVLQKTLDGVFTLIAAEEAKIRKDPTARVTELLQRVFE